MLQPAFQRAVQAGSEGLEVGGGLGQAWRPSDSSAQNTLAERRSSASLCGLGRAG